MRLRGYAVAFNLLQAVIGPGDNWTVTWLLLAALAADWAGTSLWLRADPESSYAAVGWAGMAGDTIVCSMVLANNLHDPADPVFLVVMLLAFEAALRWGRLGGVLGGLLSGAMAATWGWHVARSVEHASMRFFILAIVGGFTGSLVHRLDADQARLAALAYTDSLTGLGNRSRLHEVLVAALAGHDPVALVFLDLDAFKAVNDGFGHTAGDTVLMAVADRICRTVRQQDTVVRLGGDEFVVVVTGEVSASVDQLAERMRLAVLEPVDIDGRLLRIGVSCGTVVATAEDDVDSLLRRADHAMYAVKRGSRASGSAG